MYEIPKIKAMKGYISNYPAEFRPKNICIFTDSDGNRVYLKSNYEKVTYNRKEYSKYKATQLQRAGIELENMSQESTKVYLKK